MLFGFIFASVIYHSITKPITIPIKEVDGVPAIEMCIGEPPICLRTFLYFSSCVSFIPDIVLGKTNEQYYDPVNSNTCNIISSSDTLYYYDLIKSKIKGRIIEDLITLQNNSIVSIRFIYGSIDFYLNKKEAILGICFSPMENSYYYSFLQRQKTENSIVMLDSKTFSIEVKPHFNDKHFGYCKLYVYDSSENQRKSNESWECELQGVGIGKVFEQNSVKNFGIKKIKFENGIKNTIVPKTLYIFLNLFFLKIYSQMKNA